MINLPVNLGTILNISYEVMISALLLLSVFIVFHIVKYSYSATSRLVMLTLFLSVTSALLFVNYTLFNANTIVSVIESLIK